MEILLTPDYVYHWAEIEIARGTNYLAQGEFYLAESQLNGARGHCDGFFNELAVQDALLPELDVSLSALRAARERILEDPELALRDVLGTRPGFQRIRDAISVDNPASLPATLGRLLGFAISRLDAFEDDSNVPGPEALAKAIDDIVRDIDAHLSQTELHRTAFKSLSVQIDAALQAFAAERARPLDAPRALEVARKHVEDAKDKLDSSEPWFENAQWDLELASHALEDLSKDNLLPEETTLLSRRIADETIRFHRRQARKYLAEARGALSARNPSLARSSAKYVRFPLEHLPPDDPERDALGREAESLQQEADRLEREMEDERCRN